ncbi:hypothetical protein ABZX69_38005 [Streptomyces sp. NPDC004074]|uniref:hypothetical protein n=1 Tax=Streptomyces sp. NPDC004074 TaxID=3154277 RepID=UPI0033B59F2D
MLQVRKRPWGFRLFAATLGGLLIGALAAGPAQAEGRPQQAGPKLTALAVEQSAVDATSGDATVTIDWTVKDGNPAATDMFGAITVQQVGTDGRVIGASQALTFSFQPQWPFQASAVAGTMASADYSYAFPVPQYAAQSTARWAVVKVTAKDDQGGTFTVGRQKLARFHATFTAAHLVDSTGPTYDDLGAVLDQPEYLYNADDSVTTRYRLHITDDESGFFGGQLVLSGPQGATASGPIRVTQDIDGTLHCGDYTGYDNHDVFCTAEVTIPAGAPAGPWSISRLRLTDASGNVSVTKRLSQDPVRITQNSTVQASDFTISPAQYNNWNGTAPLTITMKPSGFRNGIASVVVRLDGCSGSVTENPVIAPDGSISVRATVPPVYTRQCTVTGIGVTDGVGESAAYGTVFHGPKLDLVATQIPDTAAPVVNSASLDVTSVPASTLPRNAVLTLDVTSFVGVNRFSLTVYDASGIPVGGMSGGVGPVTSDPLKLVVPLYQGLTPGEYTVGFTLTDVGDLHTQYGYPNGHGLPVPGGPLLITVTDD